MSKTACMVVNPVSGGKDKKPILEIIRKNFPPDISLEIIIWKKPEDSVEIARKIKERGYDIVIAAGGDGTINQMAQVVKNTNMVLAIIPLGSGNGLARHLGVPLKIRDALKVIHNGKITTIDACTINNHEFFCTTGVGFDALISQLFAESKRRGLFTYVKLTMSNFFSYQPQDYQLTIDGVQYDKKAFLITLANAAQYGNDAFIAPTADIADGLIDVVILKPFKIWQVGFIANAILKKNLHKTDYVEIYKAKSVKISRQSKGPVHFDGEPMVMDAELNYTVQPNAIKVLTP